MDVNQPESPQKVGVQATTESPAQAREAYAKCKQDLIDALSRKRAIDKQLISCEVQIYNFEASYLADTAGNGGGNIIQGFDGYLKNQGVNKRRAEVGDADRMFSNSSSTYAKVCSSTYSHIFVLSDATNLLVVRNASGGIGYRVRTRCQVRCTSVADGHATACNSTARAAVSSLAEKGEGSAISATEACTEGKQSDCQRRRERLFGYRC